VSQEEATDCGVAALAMVARFHGQSVSLAGLRQGIRLGPRGASLLELQRGAAALGFRCRAVRVGVEQLASVRLPALAHLADEHYVVVYALEHGGVVVGDPATGVVTLPTDAFRRAWTGTLLLLGRCEGRATPSPS
jgi:ATP-binding cassette subfamily B protein RaxB